MSQKIDLDEIELVLKNITVHNHETVEHLAQWVRINTKTGNHQGVNQLMTLLREHFTRLGSQCDLYDIGEAIDANAMAEKNHALSRATALIATKRVETPIRILFCGHIDSVLDPERHDMPLGLSKDSKLYGPGALDGKGGVAVLLSALQGFEAFSKANRIGWKVIITPDEEIGSPMSEILLKQSAKDYTFGLVYEPALEDGALVGSRPGSGNFEVVVHGRTAHAGREPQKGRNAVMALSEFIVSLKQLNQLDGSILVNAGSVSGGGPVNVVPDYATGRFNIRVVTLDGLDLVRNHLAGLVRQFNQAEGIHVRLQGEFKRPPKIVDKTVEYLLRSLVDCGDELGLDLQWRSTGGVCDGNTLAAAGLPNVDSLGPVGAGMHSGREYVIAETIAERAQLTALFLMKLATNEIGWPSPGR